MLQALRITDYVLFGRLDIEFGERLNVITGETGAGKSILLGALGLLVGGEVSSGLIRQGAEKAVVEGLFLLSERKRRQLVRAGLVDNESGGELVIRREISSSGRSRCFINGRMANLSVLKKLGEELIEILGQQEHQLLVKPGHQLAFLDAYGRLDNQRGEFAGVLVRRKACEAEITALEESLARRNSEKELMRFQLEEIERAAPRAGEDEKLEQEKVLLENSERIGQHLASLDSGLEGDDTGAGDNSVLGSLGALRRQLEELAGITGKAAPVLEQFDEARFLLEEVAGSLRELQSLVEHDPARLEEVHTRLDELYRLKKKYGPGLEEVEAFKQKLEAGLREAEQGRSDLDRLRKERERLSSELEKLAAELTRKRRAAASGLEADVSSRLKSLAMGDGQFKVEFASVGAGADATGPEYLTTGADRVTFLLCTNPGVPLMPLAQVASGGELSRVMLSIKSALAGVEGPSTMLFDEVDAGIGGKVGLVVGTSLSAIAGNHQVLVVTHLAQIARVADTHLLVEKTSGRNKTETVVRILSEAERPGEIARMLAGDSESELSLAHARQMLEQTDS
ncbi:MAG: DNA repair protein RecN [Gemmatimonadota bacterium]|nr:DNA repair protein RecN [Gemmatimonadota bacterium]